MIGLALKMGAIFAPRSWLDGLLIRTAFRALGFWPAAKTWLSEMKYKPAPRFGAGFVIERQLTRSGIVGRMLPQPRLNTADGSIMLDAALGDGFALLGIGIDSSAVNALSLGEDWDALIARRVALPLHEVPMFAACAGMLLLVRPDRYVMARFTLAQARQIREDLAGLLDQTWPASKARGIVNDASRKIRTAKPVLSTGDERDD
jgi:3-(3-hydroxy-phenyl)propionate hydroxylase